MYIIFQKRRFNGKIVFDIDIENSSYTKAYKLAEELISMMGKKLVPFTLPIGQRNSNYQYYVDGNYNDVYTVDIMDMSEFINHSRWLFNGCTRNDKALEKLPMHYRTHSYFDTSGMVD